MVEITRFGGSVIMLWQDHLEAQLLSYSQGHIDIWLDNWTMIGGSFVTGFYAHWQVSQRKHSWDLLKHIGQYGQLRRSNGN